MRRAAAILVALAACGGAERDRTRREGLAFECRDRSAMYTAQRHIGGELGVKIDCAAAGPRIVRWKIEQQGGTRVEDARSLSPGEFDRLWREVSGTGWENLKDCTTGTLGKDDPVYVFDIKDDQAATRFQCQSTELPFPYNGLVDPLDLAAQKGRQQLGDDEPTDLKALERAEKAKRRK